MKDHRDFIAANFPQPRVIGLGQIFAVEPDTATCDPPDLFRQQPHQRQRRHRFSTPAFPHKAQGFPGFQRKRQIIDHRRNAITGRQFDPKIFNFQQNRHQRCLNFGFNASFSPSPTSDIDKTVTKMAIPGMVTV